MKNSDAIDLEKLLNKIKNKHNYLNIRLSYEPNNYGLVMRISALDQSNKLINFQKLITNEMLNLSKRNVFDKFLEEFSCVAELNHKEK